MEHLAQDLNLDPLEFRLQNMLEKSTFPTLEQEDNPLPGIISGLKSTSSYEERLQYMQVFNANNRWKKRGLSLVPLLYLQQCGGAQFHFQLNIYQGDGTIAISCGAIEMGQGIYTKLVQTVAKELNVSMEMISMKAADTFVSPQNSPSWGSYTTDCMCAAAIVACRNMKMRLDEVAQTMQNPTWLELVQECYKRGVDLSVKHL